MNDPESPSDPKSVAEWMCHPSLAAIIDKAYFLTEIEQKLLSLLPEQFQPYLRILNIKGGCLVIASHSSAIATKIRFQEAKLLSQLQSPEVTSLECVVRPVN